MASIILGFEGLGVFQTDRTWTWPRRWGTPRGKRHPSSHQVVPWHCIAMLIHILNSSQWCHGTRRRRRTGRRVLLGVNLHRSQGCVDLLKIAHVQLARDLQRWKVSDNVDTINFTCLRSWFDRRRSSVGSSTCSKGSRVDTGRHHFVILSSNKDGVIHPTCKEHQSLDPDSFQTILESKQTKREDALRRN